ncbi:MAG TPA: AraC family transcriptional regulator, partial [Feifaniaceae bacterium]|nr:AraC family transcriptional regulator [Feifaniaceae bacterium]
AEEMSMDLASMKISDIALVIKVPQPEGSICHFSNRSESGLIFVESGRLFYEHEGRQYLSDCDHALFVPKGINYTLKCLEKSMSYVVNFNLASEGPCETLFSFDSGPSQRLLAQLDRMNIIWTFRKQSYELRCMSLLYDLLAILDEKKPRKYLPKYKYDRIACSIQYMESHFDSPGITNEALAAASEISTVYFRKLFMEKYGVPPMRYIRQKRIEKAQALLKNGYSSITGVAESTGFSSIYHFSKAFKLATGITPTEYLRQFNLKTASVKKPPQ